MESHVKRKGKPSKCIAIQSKRAAIEINRNVLTEFDESELLCLPNFNQSSSLQTNESKIRNEYPAYYNANEYIQLNTPEERRIYRNAKDLRKNIHSKTENISNAGNGICFALFRGEKCLDQTCVYGHEFRLPRKLRLCKQWKNGFCARGQFCFYLHSEFPCFFHYLGLKNTRHDPKTCPYYHGGPLCNEYEKMFLDSINLNHYPLAKEMYKNQAVYLKETAYNAVDVVHKTNTTCDDSSSERQTTPKIQINDLSLLERMSESSSETVVNNLLTEADVCQEKTQELSDESSLMIDEKHLKSESMVGKHHHGESSDESGIKQESESLVNPQKGLESSDESALVIDEVKLE